RDRAGGDQRESGQWKTVRERHLRGTIRVRNAGIADELVRLGRQVDLVDNGRVLVTLVAHVVGIDGDAVTAADHRLLIEAVGQAEARSEAFLTGARTGVPRYAAFAAD